MNKTKTVLLTHFAQESSSSASKHRKHLPSQYKSGKLICLLQHDSSKKSAIVLSFIH